MQNREKHASHVRSFGQMYNKNWNFSLFTANKIQLCFWRNGFRSTKGKDMGIRVGALQAFIRHVPRRLN